MPVDEGGNFKSQSRPRKKKADEATTRTPYQTTQPTHYTLIHLVSRNYTNSYAKRTQSDDEVYA